MVRVLLGGWSFGGGWGRVVKDLLGGWRLVERGGREW